MKNRRKGLILSLVLIIAVPVGVFAAIRALRPTGTGGGYYRNIVDRIEISADKTEFTFEKAVEGDELMQAELTLSLKKCEPDFYALLNGIDISGMDYEKAEFICTTPGLDDVSPDEILLPVNGDECVPLEFKILLTFSAAEAGELAPSLDIEYTSGLTKETSDGHLLSIPLKITVSEKQE